MQKESGHEQDVGSDRNGASIDNSSQLESHNAYRIHQLENYHHSQLFMTANSTTFFPPESLFPTSLSVTPSSDEIPTAFDNSVDTEHRLCQARLILEYHKLYDHYDLCLTRLQDVTKEMELLRRENTELKLTNRELMQRLSILSQAAIQNCLHPSPYPTLLNDFHRLSIGGGIWNQKHVSEDLSDFSPTSVIGHNRFEGTSTERITFPKSISVRSNSYLKINGSAKSSNKQSCGPSHSVDRQRVSNPHSELEQKVHVAGSKEATALELEVYNQGMSKTELCNKWQETGTCPYGGNCHFAHGINELRPVIRHPRYKTEVCRMLLSEEGCPYGHRCHFRHSFTEEEKLLSQPS